MLTNEKIIERFKASWNVHEEHPYWDTTKEDDIEMACVAVSQFCEMLRCSIGHLPTDVEEMLLIYIKDHHFSVSTVCQKAARFATQEWLNSYVDEPSEFETHWQYTKDRFLRLIEERKKDGSF